MTKWFVRELSALTGVSIQTLHHYDRIGLLKPSFRLANGYRVYSETDLLTLQQIIALKFLGFELSEIKDLLSGKKNAVDHFQSQAEILERKAQDYVKASQALKGIISKCRENKSVNWSQIVEIIEVYTMMRKLEHDWVREIFTPDELKQYADFEAEMKAADPEKQARFKENWSHFIADMGRYSSISPDSPEGIALAERCMILINDLYGKKYAHLRTKKFEKGFGEGKGLSDVGFTTEMVKWLEKAIDAYWRDRLLKILNQIGIESAGQVDALWLAALEDMYGNEEDRKRVVYDLALQDPHVGAPAKEWLHQKLMQLSQGG